SIELAKTNPVCLTLYNSLGQKIQIIYEGILPENKHTLRISTATLPTGVYFLRLTTDNTTHTEKFVITQ
ncbi:MAG: T9SS type A sorting domain-containing protein, partial [Candidatus Hodarchaeota archaeon]